MVRVVAEGLGAELEETRQVVERRPLERTIETPEMGTFEKGTQGAFRFEVQGSWPASRRSSASTSRGSTTRSRPTGRARPPASAGVIP